MKNLFFTLLLLPFAGGLQAQAGQLDHSFSSDGKFNIGIGPSKDEAKAVALQPDGKIVAAGRSQIGASYNFALLRLDPDGTPDAAFGATGKTTTAIGEQGDEAFAVAIQPDGKIVAAGRSLHNGLYNFALVRYKPDGTLDSSFNATGIVTTEIGPENAAAFAMAIQPDGKIAVAGFAWNGANTDFALVRYQSDGALDDDFGVAGVVTTDFSGDDDVALALALQPDGKIVLSGNASNGTDQDFALARYLPDGTLDITFHGDGRQTTDFNGFQDYGEALVLQPDGKMVVAGSNIAGSTQRFVAVARYQPNGDPDTGFGTGGKTTTIVNGILDMGHAVALQADGKILVAGAAINTFNKSDFALLRYNVNGSLDQSFDGDGKVTTDFAVTVDQAVAMVIQPDGKIVLAGDSFMDFALARYLPGTSVGTHDFSAAESTLRAAPNPVRDNRVTLTYTLPEAEPLRIELFDAQGKLIHTLLTQRDQEAGEHRLDLQLPEGLANGVYWIVLSANSRQAQIKIVR